MGGVHVVCPRLVCRPVCRHRPRTDRVRVEYGVDRASWPVPYQTPNKKSKLQQEELQHQSPSLVTNKATANQQEAGSSLSVIKMAVNCSGGLPYQTPNKKSKLQQEELQHQSPSLVTNKASANQQEAGAKREDTAG